MVSVLKIDVVGFDELSESLEATKIADMLCRLYDRLDALTRKHDVFKVETVGTFWQGQSRFVEHLFIVFNLSSLWLCVGIFRGFIRFRLQLGEGSKE